MGPVKAHQDGDEPSPRSDHLIPEMTRNQHLTDLTLILVFLIAGCAVNDPDSSSSASHELKSARLARPPKCGIVDLASDDYGTIIRPTSGPPGTEVVLSGTTVRGEDGRWAASDRLEAWWNTGVPGSAQPIEEGPVIQLIQVDNMERCHFEATFRVPDVEPDSYRISVFVWDEGPTEGYGDFLPHHFAVTDD
jgi:hypothetical protein